MTVCKPDTARSSGTGDSSAQWKQIWNLSVVPNIKQFIWRLAHNSLPLKMNIKRRGMKCDTLCVCCRGLDEDGAHLFLKCKEVRKVWELLGLEKVCDRMCSFGNANDVVHELLGLKECDRVLISCMWWCWWTARNKLNFEGQQISVMSVVK
jgi:hypothetical protein